MIMVAFRNQSQFYYSAGLISNQSSKGYKVKLVASIFGNYFKKQL